VETVNFDEWQADAFKRTGYRFEVGLLHAEIDHSHYANVINALMLDRSLLGPLEDVAESRYKAAVELATAPMPTNRMNPLRLLAPIFEAQHGPIWQLARLIDRATQDAFLSLRTFHRLPKRTAAEHRKHYKDIAKLARELNELISGDDWDEFSCYFSERHDGLLAMAEYAGEMAAVKPEISRPNAEDADRIYVAKDVARWFIKHIDGRRHQAAATLVNAMFPDREAIDGAYMQRLTRDVQVEPDDD
jgi:hypothetical protein